VEVEEVVVEVVGEIEEVETTTTKIAITIIDVLVFLRVIVAVITQVEEKVVVDVAASLLVVLGITTAGNH